MAPPGIWSFVAILCMTIASRRLSNGPPWRPATASPNTACMPSMPTPTTMPRRFSIGIMGSLLHAVVQGTDMGWQNTSLPAGFDPAQFHTLSISKNDSLFTFRLDGAFMQQRRFALLKGQIGLVTDGTQANYQKVSITDHSNGWEDAFGDAAEGNTSAGLRTGGWTLQGASGADGTTLGSGWNQLFRGNPNLASYTVSADLKWLQTGTTSAYPKYGIYASYNDVNNHVEVFLDRKYGVLATHAFVGGIRSEEHT